MSIYAAVGLILLAGVGGIVGVLAWMAKDQVQVSKRDRIARLKKDEDVHRRHLSRA
jgi:hypothetical protein